MRPNALLKSTVQPAEQLGCFFNFFLKKNKYYQENQAKQAEHNNYQTLILTTSFLDVRLELICFFDVFICSCNLLKGTEEKKLRCLRKNKLRAFGSWSSISSPGLHRARSSAGVRCLPAGLGSPRMLNLKITTR